jgi:hypothetical protein
MLPAGKTFPGDVHAFAKALNCLMLMIKKKLANAPLFG